MSLFHPTQQQREDPHRSVPVPMRQLIVDLKAEYPDFSLHEIAEICYVQFDRHPSHNTAKQALAGDPAPSRPTRQYPRYAGIPDPSERRLHLKTADSKTGDSCQERRWLLSRLEKRGEDRFSQPG